MLNVLNETKMLWISFSSDFRDMCGLVCPLRQNYFHHYNLQKTDVCNLIQVYGPIYVGILEHLYDSECQN